ncbi:MAG TPA: glycosyltransferase family 39 protein [Pyrinomonadaceae bacterium]
MQPSALAKRLFILLFLIIVAFYFYGLGQMPLVGPDEPRYAQVAREMFMRGDLITPTLGGHTWFEKPALLYWLMIAGYKIFGVTEFAARFGTALCGLLTVVAVAILTHGFERSNSESAGLNWWSTMAAATGFGMIVFSRGATFDIVVTMTLTWAFTFYFLHERALSLKNKRLLLVGFYAAVGLSLLAKGLIGIVVPVGVIGLYHLVQRRWPSRGLLVSVLWGFPISLLIAAVWYGPVISRHGWTFINDFFIQHHFARYVSDRYQHPQRIYFYIPILLMLTVPWTGFVIDAFARLSFRKADTRNAAASLNVFAASWIIFPLVFFSFSGSKLPGYLLPAIPAAAILIGERMMRVSSGTGSRWPVIASGVIAVVLAVGGIYYAFNSGALSVSAAVLISLPMLVAGLIAVMFSRFATAALLAVALGSVLTLGLVVRFAAGEFAERQSTKQLLAVADARGFGSAPLFIRRDDRSPEFYASSRVVYGADGEPERLEAIKDIVAETERRGERILVLVPLENLDQYKNPTYIEIIGDNGTHALLATKLVH